MSTRTIPYTAYDLIQIGNIVEQVTHELSSFEAGSDSSIEPHVGSLRVDILYDGEVAGHLGYCDGWIGFYPDAVDS